MRFEWDPAKDAATLAERGFSFVAVLDAFTDPKRRISQDTRRHYGERRFNMIAQSKGRIFHVTFTYRGETIRIISARRANRREERRYAQG
jgi:hypothetical protein